MFSFSHFPFSLSFPLISSTEYPLNMCLYNVFMCCNLNVVWFAGNKCCILNMKILNITLFRIILNACLYSYMMVKSLAKLLAFWFVLLEYFIVLVFRSWVDLSGSCDCMHMEDNLFLLFPFWFFLCYNWCVSSSL